MKMETTEVKIDFYQNLSSLIDELSARGLSPSEIYNTDETGLCFVTKSGRVISVKGKKRAYVKKIGERGQNTTVVATVNATGSVTLPPTIFRGKLLSSKVVLSDSPPGTIFATSPRSFMNTELFEEVFVRFIELIPPARPVLRILDGHGSHISLNVIRLALQNDIHMLCLLPHTTHLYQPLDKGVFAILKKEFAKAEAALMRKNKLTKIGKQHFCQLLNTAWRNALTPANIIAGFEGTGIWPLNSARVMLPCEEDNGDDTVEGEDTENDTAGSHILVEVNVNVLNSNLQDGAQCQVSLNVSQSTASTSKPSAVVQAISKLLEPEPTPNQSSRQVTKTRILTSKEFVQEMEIKQKAKEDMERQKIERQEARKRKADEKARGKENSKKQKPGRKRKTTVMKQKHKTSDDGSDNSFTIDNPEQLEADEEQQDLCGKCQGSFQKDFHGEQWICCSDCKAWFHMTCVGLSDDEYSPSFKCYDCVPLILRLQD